MPIIDTPNKLPSVDRLLHNESVVALIREHGTPLVTLHVRSVLETARSEVLAGGSLESADLINLLSMQLEKATRPSLQKVFNLTGTVLHSNLGRAALPDSAIEAMKEVAQSASNLEFDLVEGKRGERQQHIDALICELTGAQGAMVVNNNAAAVLLTLNSLALQQEVPVSRGELVEIGGSFRLPDIMTRAGCHLIEVGTTNRTHAKDFTDAISTRTAMLMKVHTSNFDISGFTKQVTESELAQIAREHALPFVTDLGSGTLVNLEDFGLPHEPTVQEALQTGADLVLFSGDKLLGGPQAGIIAGRRDLLEKIQHNPMTRAMRPDKVTLAALHAVLRLYSHPDKLAEELPTLRLLTRDVDELNALAKRLSPVVQAHCQQFQVSIEPSSSQVGSGAMPVETIDSISLTLSQPGVRRPGRSLSLVAKAFRDLPTPVIGRISEDALKFDLRCLEDETAFVDNLHSFLAP